MMKTLQLFLIAAAITFQVIQLQAQNVIPNNGFETNTGLPSGPAMYNLATGWDNCNGGGSADYFHINGTGIVQLPNCFVGHVNPLSGNAVMGFCSYYPGSNPNFREYVDIQLTTPLTAGNTYNVSIHVTNGICSGQYGGLGIDQFSIAFSTGQLTQLGTGPISYTPQLTVPGILYDTAWQTINLQFTATAAFDHITFGNFQDDANTTSASFASPNSLAYYFIDDVEVEIASAVYFNTCAGDSTIFQNNASPGTIATQWIFGDAGSGYNDTAYTTNAAHIFSAPGTYTVTTINYQLSGNNDSLFTTVVISPPPAVNLGNDTTLCNGQQLTLSVNSGYTSYQWSTGDTGNSINVSAAGIYFVTVSDNGCTNADTIIINSTNCSPIISLAASDTSFCEKNCIDFFDLSTNSPTSWQWFFPGSDSTSSNVQNPTGICYNSLGSFDVTLIACNGTFCDTLVLPNFINEYPNPTDSIWGANDTLFSLPANSYQWYEVTNGLISGAINQYYIPTSLGNYYCVITDSIGCVGTSNIVGLTAGPPTPEGGVFTVTPNPNNGIFEISFGLNSPFGGKGALVIYDAVGQMVFNTSLTTHQSLLTTSLKDGIYFVEVKTEERVYRKKMVVKR